MILIKRGLSRPEERFAPEWGYFLANEWAEVMRILELGNFQIVVQLICQCGVRIDLEMSRCHKYSRVLAWLFVLDFLCCLPT